MLNTKGPTSTTGEEGNKHKKSFLEASLFGLKSKYPALAGVGFLTQALDSPIDYLYSGIRHAEHYVPVLRVAAKTSGIADMLSPFLPARSLRWNFSGEEVLDRTNNQFKGEFSKLKDRILGSNSKLSEATLLDQVGTHGIEFRKTGRVFGDVYLRGTDTKLLGNVFAMERGQYSGSAIVSIFEAGRRQVGLFPALSDESVSWVNNSIFGGSLSTQWQSRLAKTGGFLKGYAGSLMSDYVGAMNRFLKEPLPVLDRIFATEKLVEYKAETLLDQAFGRTIGAVEQRLETIPYGRLPDWLRPYVSGAKWTENKALMLAGIAGKGAMLAVGLPTAYSALDYARSQTSDPFTRIATTPLWAAAGYGAGALIESAPVNFLHRAAGRSYPSLGGVTRTQLGGALIGTAIGALPIFDKGITAGLANSYARVHLGLSKFWNMAGGADIAERQERLMPGITSPWTGVGFAMGGGIYSWITSEIGTIPGLIDLHRIKKGGGARFDAAQLATAIAEQDMTPLTVEQKLLLKESKGYVRTVREVEQILAGSKRTPITMAGVTAQKYREILSSKGELDRLATAPMRLEESSAIINESRRLISEAERDYSRLKASGYGSGRGTLEKVKDVVRSPRPGFWRGAARGALAFGAIAEVGALAAGIAGGDFRPAALLPGWLINLTGGGTRPNEQEDIYAGKKEVAIRKARFWSMGRCITGTTLIKTGFSVWKPASEIDLSDTLVASDGSLSNICNIWSRDYSGPVVAITTILDRNNITTLTPNHIVPILKERDVHCQHVNKEERFLVQAPASDIKPGDYVQVPITDLPNRITILDLCQLPLTGDIRDEGQCLYIYQRNRYGHSFQKTRSPSFPRFLALTSELAYWLGVFVAEGNLSFHGKSKEVPGLVELTFHKKEDYIYNRLVKFLTTLGIRSTIRQVPPNIVKLRVSHRIFASLIFVLVYDNVKGSCHNKKIPDCILSAPAEVKQSFVDGWFDGDGHFDEETKIISSANYDLSQSLQGLLLSLGQFASISPSEFRSLPQYSKIYQRWGIRYDGSSQGHIWRDEQLFVRVKKTEISHYAGKVYDFEIRHPAHLFTAGTFLVHNSPFEGGKIQYFRQHRIAMAQTDARDIALYGSTAEKLAYEPLLHPLKTLSGDQEFLYHRERRMMYESPTPMTGRLFTDVPIVGDILAATLGEVLKPSLAIRPSEWLVGGSGVFKGPFVQPPPSYLGDEGGGGHAPPALSLGSPPAYRADLPNDFSVTARRFTDRFLDQSGLKGFITESLLGIERSYSPVIESAERGTSLRTRFWEMNLGDPLGLSEATRRYLIRDKTSYYNPLKNTAASWLPGEQSKFYKNFQRGNYYSSVDEGWARLPGRGYAALHPEYGLEGTNPEEYPLSVRYKILSDVGYGSKEWELTKQMVIAQLQTGGLTRKDREMISETNRQLEEKKARKNFRNYKFAKDALVKKTVHVTGVLEDGSFTVAEMGNRVLSLGGLNISMAGLAREAIRTQAASTTSAAQRLAQNRRTQIIDEVRKHLGLNKELDIFIHHDDIHAWKDSSTKAYIPELSKKILKIGAELEEGMYQREIEYNKTQKAIGKIWEMFSHNADAPITPAAALNFILPFQPQSKFIQRLSPIEDYARSQVYGREIQMWQRYLSDFVESGVNEWRSKVAGDFVPKQVQYRRTMTDYFDRLTYLKYFLLEQSARQAGNEEAAVQYAQVKKTTRFGVDPYRGFSEIWRSLPRSERDYYQEFVDADSEEDRQRILALVPDASKKLYIAQWQGKELGSLKEKAEAGVITKDETRKMYALYNVRRVEGREWTPEKQKAYENQAPDGVSYADWNRIEELKEYFQQFKLPDANWVGFRPECDLKDVHLKQVQNEDGEIHDYGFWESQAQEIEYKPYIGPAAEGVKDWERGSASPTQVQSRFNAILSGMRQYGRVSTTPGYGGGGNKVAIIAKDNRLSDVKRVLNGYGDV